MTLPSQIQRPIVSDNSLVLIVYVLYLAAFFTGITELIGVVIAYVKIEDTDPVLRSHYQFQIRTFWIGLLYVVVGVPLCMVIIGFPLLVWSAVWFLVRVVKGILALNEGKPIANPTSWLFG